MFSSFLLMYLAMWTIESIISHTRLENQFRQFAEEMIEDLSDLIVRMAEKSTVFLSRLQEIIKEDTFYFYFDGEQFIPLPDLSFSTDPNFIERIAHSDFLHALPVSVML